MEYSKKQVRKKISETRSPKTAQKRHNNSAANKSISRIASDKEQQKRSSSGTTGKTSEVRKNIVSSRAVQAEKTAQRRRASQRTRSKDLGAAQNRENLSQKTNMCQTPQKAQATQFRGPAMAPPPKKRRPMAKGYKFLIMTVLFALICSIAYCGWLVAGNINSDLSSSSSLSEYHISNEAATIAKNHRIVNIAIFGIDGRIDSDVEGDRSDTMMIVSADFEHGGIKISSIMRDTFVWIPEEDDYDKINAAFALGGAEEALKTINHNFDTAVTDYVTINFDSMIYMVNAVGGVEVNIEDEDVLYWTNEYIGDVNFNCGTNSGPVPGTGAQILDGSQALAFCRVRFTGNGDFDRTMRQREVFKQVVTKTLALNPIRQYALLKQVLPYVKTSLNTKEIMKYALNVMVMKGQTLSQMQIPASDYCEAGYYDGVSYVFPKTLVDSIKTWYHFVYEQDYTPSRRAQEISEEISYIW